MTDVPPEAVAFLSPAELDDSLLADLRGGGWAARLTGPGALPHAPTSRRAAAGPLVVAALATLAHLVVGYCYAVGGFVIPGYVLIALWLFWAALA